MSNRDIVHREVINDLLVRLFNQILDIESRYMRAHGIVDISISELHLLETISTFDYPTMSDIAQKAMLTNGSVTIAIKRLEEKGYVIRQKDQQDRRVIRVRLTSKAIKSCQIHQSFHDDMVANICDDSPVIEDEILLQSLQQLVYFFDEVKEKYIEESIWKE